MPREARTSPWRALEEPVGWATSQRVSLATSIAGSPTRACDNRVTRRGAGDNRVTRPARRGRADAPPVARRAIANRLRIGRPSCDCARARRGPPSGLGAGDACGAHGGPAGRGSRSCQASRACGAPGRASRSAPAVARAAAETIQAHFEKPCQRALRHHDQVAARGVLSLAMRAWLSTQLGRTAAAARPRAALATKPERPGARGEARLPTGKSDSGLAGCRSGAISDFILTKSRPCHRKRYFVF